MADDTLTQVAVGLDFETDSPWVWTHEKVEEDCEDCTGWFAVDVPTAMVERFKAAQAELDEALTAIHEHVGFDAQWSRLREPCDTYTGSPLVVGDRTFHDDCDRCGWKKVDHDA